jgi:DNA primase
MRGLDQRKIDAKKYSESHVRSILRAINIRIATETGNDFLCFCPIHGNKHTPSMSVSKTKDGYLCFNSDCGASGTLVDLVAQVSGRNYFEALRFVLQHEPTEQEDFEDELGALLSDIQEYEEFAPEKLAMLYSNMCEPENAGREYMHGRGFTDDTIDYFRVGYSKKQNMVAVPAHSPDGIPIGVIGRGVGSKVFKNSVGMHTSKMWFNLHRAKRVSSTAIITEASFDAIKIHQAGFPNAIAGLGSHLSEVKMQLLDKYFDRFIIMTDNRDFDTAGLAMGVKIAERFISTKDVLWAQYSWVETYPRGVKDATDMTDEEIVTTISNAVPHYELSMVQ